MNITIVVPYKNPTQLVSTAECAADSVACLEYIACTIMWYTSYVNHTIHTVIKYSFVYSATTVDKA